MFNRRYISDINSRGRGVVGAAKTEKDAELNTTMNGVTAPAAERLLRLLLRLESWHLLRRSALLSQPLFSCVQAELIGNPNSLLQQMFLMPKIYIILIMLRSSEATTVTGSRCYRETVNYNGVLHT